MIYANGLWHLSIVNKRQNIEFRVDLPENELNLSNYHSMPLSQQKYREIYQNLGDFFSESSLKYILALVIKKGTEKNFTKNGLKLSNR